MVPWKKAMWIGRPTAKITAFALLRAWKTMFHILEALVRSEHGCPLLFVSNADYPLIKALNHVHIFLVHLAFELLFLTMDGRIFWSSKHSLVCVWLCATKHAIKTNPGLVGSTVLQNMNLGDCQSSAAGVWK